MSTGDWVAPIIPDPVTTSLEEDFKQFLTIDTHLELYQYIHLLSLVCLSDIDCLSFLTPDHLLQVREKVN